MTPMLSKFLHKKKYIQKKETLMKTRFQEIKDVQSEENIKEEYNHMVCRF